jgi:hypothetical protein
MAARVEVDDASVIVTGVRYRCRGVERFQRAEVVAIAAFVGDAFCAARLGSRGRAFGTLPAGADADAILSRALRL